MMQLMTVIQYYIKILKSKNTSDDKNQLILAVEVGYLK